MNRSANLLDVDHHGGLDHDQDIFVDVNDREGLGYGQDMLLAGGRLSGSSLAPLVDLATRGSKVVLSRHFLSPVRPLWLFL